MARHAEITMRFVVSIDTIRYNRLKEWSERLFHITKRRITRLEHSQLTVRTWHDDS